MSDTKTKQTIKTATKDQRKKWIEQSKKTRKKNAEEKKQLFIQLQSRDLEDLIDLVNTLNFFVRGLKVNRLNKREKRITLEVLSLLEKI